MTKFKLSELSIPRLEIPNEINPRLSLISNYKMYSVKKLSKLMQFNQIKKSSTKQDQELLNFINSESLELNEIDRIILYAARLISTIDQNKSKLDKDYLNTINIFMRDEVRRVRAKLALLEIVATIFPDSIIPKLINFDSCYVSSSFTAEWIRGLQLKLRFGSKKEKKDAQIIMKDFIKAIYGNRRIKPRLFGYWNIYLIYQKLKKEINIIQQAGQHSLLNENIVFGVDLRKMSVLKNKNLFFSAKSTPEALAIQELINLGMINEEKQFRDIQSKLNKIRKSNIVDKELVGVVPITTKMQKKIKDNSLKFLTTKKIIQGKSQTLLLIEDLLPSLLGFDFLDQPTLNPRLLLSENISKSFEILDS